MTAAADIAVEGLEGDRLARRNAVILGIAQALAGANNTVIVTAGAILGGMIAPEKGLATLPVTMFVLGTWAGTIPVGIMARNIGRRFSLQAMTGFGMIAGIVNCAAVLQGSFPLLLTGAFCCGLYGAGHQSYRFAAADTASDDFRPKAISWVLAGGVFAGLVGPQLMIFTKDIWQPFLFAATFLSQTVVALGVCLLLALLKFPAPVARSERARGRSLRELLQQPRFVVAAVCGVTAYAMMNMVMTSAPLAMLGCNHSVTEATLGIQWHVLAMFLPSFVTGSLVARFGIEKITGLGLLLLVASASVGEAGTTLWHFWIDMILLGIGWNFAFIGATASVTQCYRPEERNKVQAFNDFLIFGSMAICSFASGKLLASFGWGAVNGLLYPVVFATGGLLLWMVLHRRRARWA